MRGARRRLLQRDLGSTCVRVWRWGKTEASRVQLSPGAGAGMKCRGRSPARLGGIAVVWSVAVGGVRTHSRSVLIPALRRAACPSAGHRLPSLVGPRGGVEVYGKRDGKRLMSLRVSCVCAPRIALYIYQRPRDRETESERARAGPYCNS